MKATHRFSRWQLLKKFRSHTRRRRAARPTTSEQLESRLYLTISTLFADSTLTVVVDEGHDSVSIGTDPTSGTVRLLENGVVSSSLPPILPSQVGSIHVIGSDGNNTIDLRGINPSDFTFVDSGTGNGLQILVDAGNGNDTIFASSGFADVLRGGHGDDLVDGGAGTTTVGLTIEAGDGQDTIFGSSGSDTIDAGDGHDSVLGGLGDDSIFAGDGNDTVNAGAGNDSVDADEGADSVLAGDGDDFVNGSFGQDTLHGQAGDDVLIGGADNDSIRGTGGNDRILGNGGRDFIDGDLGDDEIRSGGSADTVFGNTGNDTINGGAGNDAILGDSGDDSLLGGGGDDTVNGAAGDDFVAGNSGDDDLCGGGGSDEVMGDAGGDTINSVCPFPRSLSIDDIQLDPEGDTGTTTVTFTVTLSQPYFHEVEVDFRTMDGNAVSTIQPAIGTSDYNSTSGRLLFAPGVTTLTISVDVNADTLVEGDENFFVVLENPERAELADGYGEATIVNDDAPPPPIVDIALALDDSGSYVDLGATLAAQFPGIISRLEQQLPQFTIGFGVSRFEDYGLNAFVLNQPIIESTTPNFQQAIEAALMRAAPGVGGDQNVQETFLEALYQIATGDGFDGNANGSRTDQGPAGLFTTQTTAAAAPRDIPNYATFVPDFFGDPLGPILPPTDPQRTDDGIGFRNEDAINQQEFLRLVLVATDNNTTRLDDGQSQYTGVNGVTVPAADILNGGAVGSPAGVAGVPFTTGASIQQTIDALVARQIRVIGIGGDTGTNPDAPDDPMGSPRQPLEAYSILTGGINESGVSIPGTIPADPIDPGDPLYFIAAPDAGDVLADSIVASVLGSIGPPVVEVDPYVIVEGDSQGTRQVTVELRLRRAPTVDATVDFEFLDGSAINGEDYTGASGTVTFAAASATSSGDISQTITFTLGEDVDFESDESFTLRLFNPSAGIALNADLTITELTTSVTIINDDPAPDAGDTLLGREGNDTIDGSAGTDLIVGDQGNDVLRGNGNNDSIYGGAGHDRLEGNAGDDSLTGNAGHDTLIGGVGEDTIVWKGDGLDVFGAESGADTVRIQGTNADDTFVVGQDGSTLTITQGMSVLRIEDDGDPLAAGAERVELHAGAGNDLVTITDINDVGFHALIIHGDSGRDRIDATGAAIGSIAVVLDGGADSDTVIGSAGGETILGGDGDDFLNGMDGDDSIFGGAGDDSLRGDDGNDALFGEGGADSLNGGDLHDTLDGGFGNDELDGDDGNDTLIGGFGDDFLLGNFGDDSLEGFAGRDTLIGAANDDTLNGGRNDDVLIGNHGNDHFIGDHGNDFIKGGTGDDTIDAGDGNDVVNGEDGADLIAGGDGNDDINGSNGRDTILGGDGNDNLIGGGAPDIALGGDGDDTVLGNGGSDTIAGNLGADVLLPQGMLMSPTEIDETFVLSRQVLDQLSLS